jgi:hypothetical protein
MVPWRLSCSGTLITPTTVLTAGPLQACADSDCHRGPGCCKPLPARSVLVVAPVPALAEAVDRGTAQPKSPPHTQGRGRTKAHPCRADWEANPPRQAGGHTRPRRHRWRLQRQGPCPGSKSTRCATQKTPLFAGRGPRNSRKRRRAPTPPLSGDVIPCRRQRRRIDPALRSKWTLIATSNATQRVRFTSPLTKVIRGKDRVTMTEELRIDRLPPR